MKNLMIAAFMLGNATTVSAGALAYTPPEAVGIEEPARMGGSSAWIVPLVIAAVVVLALSSNCNRNLGQNAKVPSCGK